MPRVSPARPIHSAQMQPFGSGDALPGAMVPTAPRAPRPNLMPENRPSTEDDGGARSESEARLEGAREFEESKRAQRSDGSESSAGRSPSVDLERSKCSADPEREDRPSDGSESSEQAELVACMRDYQAGSLAGFERLHARLASDVERFFRAAERSGAGLAQDLAQETFLELHRARRTYLPPLPVRPWVFGIARNVERRHRRERARRSRVFQDGLPPEPSTPPRTLESADLRAALDRLPPGGREAWQLHHVHGWSFAEIAARLGIGSGAAKLRSSRAARALRAFLSGERGDDA